MQVERLGFGTGIPTERLTPANPSFVHRQLQRLLEDDQYKVAHPHHTLTIFRASISCSRLLCSRETAGDMHDAVI